MFVRIFIQIGVAIAAICLFASSGFAQTAAKPTDPQIAHIAYTADQIDIQAAHLALKKSENKDVRAFASDMVRDHTAVNNKALALLKKLKVKPEDNDTSRQLSKQASDKRAELSKLNGSAFDKAYVDNEVAYHKTVNDALQNTLIPSASNQELKDLLTTGLKIFQDHQQHAEQVATEFKQPADAPARPEVRRAPCSGLLGCCHGGAGARRSDPRHDGADCLHSGANLGLRRRHRRMGQQGYRRAHRDGPGQ